MFAVSQFCTKFICDLISTTMHFLIWKNDRWLWSNFEAVVSSVVCLKSNNNKLNKSSCEWKLYLLYRGLIKVNLEFSFSVAGFHFPVWSQTFIRVSNLSSQNLSLNFILSSLAQQFSIMAMGFKFYFSWVLKPRFSISSF